MKYLIFTDFKKEEVLKFIQTKGLNLKEFDIHLVSNGQKFIANYILTFLEGQTTIENIIWFDTKNKNLDFLFQLINAVENQEIALIQSISTRKKPLFLDEKYFLKQGRFISNGFAVKVNSNSLGFLKWWRSGFNQLNANNLYAQSEALLLNHVPVLFSNVKILCSANTIRISLKTRILYYLSLKLESLIKQIDNSRPYWN